MDEQILAVEESVLNRGVGLAEQIETAFGMGKATEGTLILTDRRLVYVHGAERRVDIPIGLFSKKRLFYSEVESLDQIPPDPGNLAVQLSSLVGVEGHRREATSPKLVVRWNEGRLVRVTEFVQQVTGASRRRNLDDWAPVIERLRSHGQIIVELPPLPAADTLEGRVVRVLGDMQEKGALTVEEEVERYWNTDLDPDEVEGACERLASMGLVKRVSVPGEDVYYRRLSPLAEDDLSP